MMYWYDNGSAWTYALMMIGMGVFWLVLIGGFALVIRSALGGTARPPAPDQSPEQLLAQRFARGEISADQYRDAIETLRHHHAATPS